MTPDKLFKKIDEIERTHSLKDLQEKAKKKGLSPSGTKREIVIRLFGKHARDYRPPAVPMTDRKHHQYGDKRTAFYIQYWAPKSDPEISQPYYYSGPEEGGTYKDLNQALRAASEVQRERPDAFQIDIYSQTEEWIAEAEDPRYGHWEIVEGTVKAYDLRGKLHYDEAKPNYAPMTSSSVAIFRTWVDEWAAKLKVTPPRVEIGPTDKMMFVFDHERYTIIIDPIFDTVAQHKSALRGLKYAVAHELAHAVSLKRYGAEQYVRKLRTERSLLEEEADAIAERLSGLTDKQAWHLIEPHLPWPQKRPEQYKRAPMTGAPTEDDLLKYYTVPPEAR